MPRILDVLLDLAFLPSRCRITELGFEQIMADHREEASVDVALLAAPDLVDGGAHIVVNPPARHAAQHAKGVIMGVRSEEHTSELQSLMRISYAVFCLKKKINKQQPINQHRHTTTN